jgi:hypothetical protein
MSRLKAGHLVSLVFLLIGCEPSPSSRMMELPQNLKDDFEGLVRSIDIQPGTGKDPNVCFVKKDGQLVCHTAGQHHAAFTAFRNLGPLNDISGSCVVTQFGTMLCTMDGRDPNQPMPLERQMLHRISLLGSKDLCALINDGNGNLAKCYDGKTDYRVAYPSTMTVTNHEGATVQKIDQLLSIDQAREQGHGDRIACGRMSSGRSWCHNVTTNKAMAMPANLLVRSMALNSSMRCVATPAGKLSCETLKGGPVTLPGILRKDRVVEVTGRDQRMCARYHDGDFACWEGMQVYQRRRFNTFQKAMKVQPSPYGICAVFADERTRCLEPVSGSLIAYEELRADALVASHDQTCSTSADGKLNCWGLTRLYDVPKNLPFPTGQEVAVGSQHLCYADDGRVHCQGNNDRQQLAVPAALATEYVTQLAGSQHHTCALTQSQKVFCWGENQEGSTAVPVDLPAAKSITTGKSMSCAIGEDDQLHCWGTPFLVTDARKVKKVREVAIGDSHFCVLDLQKQPSCYGTPSEGKTIPFPAPNGFVQLKAGADHSCAIDAVSSVPYCWGSNDEGQTVIPDKLHKASKLALGENHSCATDLKNKVVCWGRDQARDVEGRFEISKGALRQEYRNGLVRHVPFKQPIGICKGQDCQLPEEPLLSFKGLTLTELPVNESYALWVDYQSSCPLQVEWLINGTIRPDLTVNKNNLPLNPRELRKKALFYKHGAPLTKFDSAIDGKLVGPSILEARIRTADGRLVRSLPASCQLQINNVVILPSTDTTTAWSQMTIGTSESSYLNRLKNSLILLTEYKQIEESQIINTRKSALALHTSLRQDFIREVKAAIDLAVKAGAEAEIGAIGEHATPDAIRDQLMVPARLQLLGMEGQTEPYDTFVMKKEFLTSEEQAGLTAEEVSARTLPEWFFFIPDYLDAARQASFDSTLMAYTLSIDLLQAPISADTDGRIRRLAGGLARGPIQVQMRKVARFLSETQVIRMFLDEASRMAKEDLHGTLDDSNPVDLRLVVLGDIDTTIRKDASYASAIATLKDYQEGSKR